LNGALDIKELRKVFTNSPKSAIFSDYWEMRNTILKIPIYIILFISYYITNLINKHFPTYSHDIENYDYDIISQSSSYIDLTAREVFTLSRHIFLILNEPNIYILSISFQRESRASVASLCNPLLPDKPYPLNGGPLIGAPAFRRGRGLGLSPRSIKPLAFLNTLGRESDSHGFGVNVQSCILVHIC
jgi:hypothetical protein